MDKKVFDKTKPFDDAMKAEQFLHMMERFPSNLQSPEKAEGEQCSLNEDQEEICLQQMEFLWIKHGMIKRLYYTRDEDVKYLEREVQLLQEENAKLKKKYAGSKRLCAEFHQAFKKLQTQSAKEAEVEGSV